MKKITIAIILVLCMALVLGACEQGVKLSDEAVQQTAIARLVETAMFQESQTPIETPTEVLPTETEVPTEEATEEPTSTPTEIPVITRFGPSNFPENVNPLTGLEVEDPAILNRMPVFVKVPNFPAFGRPHGGLSKADIVFEYWIGGGSNRFAAMYYGQDSDQVWPIRSIRIIDPELATLYQGVVAFSGGDPYKVMPKVYRVLGNRLFPEGICPGICDNGRGDVARLYANTEAISSYFKSVNVDPGTRPQLDGMVFDSAVPEGGKDATKAMFYFNNYNKGDWVYDEESGKYKRWIEDGYTYEMIPLLDRNTNEQVAFSNFIMIFADHIEIETQLIDTKIWNNTEGKRAVIFRDGKAYEAIWKTLDNEKPMQFFDKDGNLFPLKPGNTWIGITGVTSPNSVDGSEWYFGFSMP